MFLALGICEFINYMEYFHNTKVEKHKKDLKYGWLITESKKDNERIKEAIEMFMFEYNL